MATLSGYGAGLLTGKVRILCDETVAERVRQHAALLPDSPDVTSFNPARYEQALQDAIAEEEKNTDGRIVLILPYHLLRDYWPPIFSGTTCIQPFPYLHEDNCGRWFDALQSVQHLSARAVVTCMQKPFYDKWARRIAYTLERISHYQDVLLRPPCETDREELAGLLAEGFRVAFYCGHGRSRGFSGYRGIRWSDLARPVPYVPGGVFISLTCSSLSMDKEHSNPIGIEWINSGRLAAFVGFTTSVRIQPLTQITRIILREMEGVRTLEELLRRLYRRAEALDVETVSTLRNLRLVGTADVAFY